ncbi:MAG: FN3 associated domain-containing protein [Bacteroidales bacterium]
MKFAYSFALLLFSFVFQTAIIAQSDTRSYYQDPTWKPRAILPYDDAITGNFWPKSPAVNNTFNDPDFDESRLSKVPAPGVHPRVLITPDDVEKIRAKVALGDKAPIAFRTMWSRVSKSQNAFYALVTKNDALGKELASQLVDKLKTLEPKLDYMDKQPDGENIWAVDRSIIAMGNPDPPTEIWDLLDYDYLSCWMSASERELALKVIGRIVKHRISNYLAYPDHFMINNHQGFGMEYIRLMLLIEGEKGFNKELFEQSCHKANAMLDWFLSDDGMCYESIKGWLNISAFTAVGLRQRNLLKHDHLRAKMRFFEAAIRWENGKWMIRDEMRASAFHVIWMMHYYHPNNQAIDFLYQSTLSTHDFLTDANAKWPNPVGICTELLLLYADAGMVDSNGKPTDWTIQSNIDKLKLPLTWQDNVRGYVDTRNSWRKEDLHVGFVCKQDFFYGGHEGSENNRLTLWKDGVNWIQDNNMLATKATFLQNMLTIDGKGCHWPPTPGTWLGVRESPEGLIAVGDGKDGYSYSKNMQVHPLYYPSTKIPYYAPFAEGNFDLSRDIQVAFNPRTIKFFDGYGHTDYGPWSGETRLVEGYSSWNPMQQFYRTVQMARGQNPYLLVIDDAKKDEQKHLFEWNISVPLDVDLVEAITPEIQFQNTNPSESREGDIILGKIGMERDVVTGKSKPKKGDPLCLIRVLWRNAEYGFPVPRFERYQGYNQVAIPAQTVSPEFRILVYPYKFGEPLPKSTWNSDRTKLTIEIGKKKDVYQFAKTDGGRTVLTMQRDGKTTLTSDAKPARPVLTVRGERFDINDLRYTRDENKVPTYLIDDKGTIQLERVAAPAQIRYTLDGSQPTENSTLYERPITITKTADLKAIVYDPTWTFGTQNSETITAHLVLKAAPKGLTTLPVNAQNGLLARVYEKNTKLYNDKGFFDASRIMMPDLNKETPILATTVAGFILPKAISKQPLEEQTKGFYRFSGLFLAKEKGVYHFDVNSCGPVTFDVDNQSVIEHIGVFHQQQAHRRGEVVLDKGWHAIDLVICDPLFWNINSLKPMDFEVSYSINGGKWKSVEASELSFETDAKIAITPPSEVKSIEPLKSIPSLEKGFVAQSFDRTGKRRDADFLDIDNAKPYKTQLAQAMESSESRNIVREFSGYFYVPMTGVYEFQTTYRVGESAGLNAKQASCQNQVRVNNEIVVQHGVFGRNPDGKIGLKEGWYPLSVRFGSSETTVKVLFPDGQTVQLTDENVFRKTNTKISNNPKDGFLGEVSFDKWDEKTPDYAVNGAFQIWINPACKLVDSPFGKALEMHSSSGTLAAAVDVNVSRGNTKPGFKLHHLAMRENAISIALWFKTSEKSGKLFGKDGYNAYGKGYKTVSCNVDNNRIVANPNRLSGGKIASDEWQFVVLTATEDAMNLYLNGDKIATAPGTLNITTDALDFFLNHTATVANLRVYDRPLDAVEVKQLFDLK